METGDQQSGRFAFNCDIATPMRRGDAAVFAVDLFADVLVRADSITYQVCDLEPTGASASAPSDMAPGEPGGSRSNACL